MSVPLLDSGGTRNTSLRSREFPRAWPSGTPSSSGCYFLVPPLSRKGTVTVHVKFKCHMKQVVKADTEPHLVMPGFFVTVWERYER